METRVCEEIVHVTHKAFPCVPWRDTQEGQHTLLGGVVTTGVQCVLKSGWTGHTQRGTQELKDWERLWVSEKWGVESTEMPGSRLSGLELRCHECEPQ